MMTIRLGWVLRNSALGLLGLLVVVTGFLLSRPGETLTDLGSFIAAGRLLLEGQDPYGWHPLVSSDSLRGQEHWFINLNPPASLALCQILAPLDPIAARPYWYALSLALYGLTLWVLRRAQPHRWPVSRLLWACTLAGLWHTLLIGNLFVIMALIAAGTWLAFSRGRLTTAGILIGLLIALKPPFLALPGLLLLAGHRRLAVVGLAVAATFSFLPLPFYGIGVYQRWLEVSADVQWLWHPYNSSLIGFAARLGYEAVGTVGAALLCVWLAWLSWCKRPSVEVASAWGLLAAVIASPIAWPGYTLTLLPLFGLWHWSRTIVLAALLLSVPYFGLWFLWLATPENLYPWCAVYTYALFLLLLVSTRPLPRVATPAPG